MEKDTYEQKEERRRKQMSDSRKRRVARLKAAGLCTSCGKCPPLPGIQICGECRDKRNSYDRKKYRVNQRSKMNATNLARYYKRKEAGICTYCGKVPADGGCTTCAACREKLLMRSHEKARINREKKDVSLMREVEGVCFHCGEDRVVYQDKFTKKWLCRECYARRLRAIETARKSVKMHPRSPMFHW